ncbi:eukaryotic aspartyl protease [Teladorsagia circumcincta]|uniref:Eukaryotic aspartyl protease n=1 Tax=Teladorsagia circumcincta TaxID=45464 RepID=A0A2G9UN21_TELCI|nr:eukaryotic aspartyl protease [Teladorsagia circumcincta]
MPETAVCGNKTKFENVSRPGLREDRIQMIERGVYAQYLQRLESLRYVMNLDTMGQRVDDYADYEYVGNITIGTPGQPFVVFGGEDEDQLAVPDTTFGLATHISSDFRSDPTDGILGLAFTSLAENNVVPPLINAIRQNLLDEPIFTVWMAHRGAEEGVHGGMFTYGGFDKENCGPIIAYEPLTSATYFQFRMKAIGAGKYKSKIPYEVISDTGTSFIGGPKSITDRLARAVGAKYVADEDSYVIPCNAKPPTLDIYIGSHKYPIEPVNYIVSVCDDNV